MLDLHRKESEIASRMRVVMRNSFALLCRYLFLFYILLNSGCQTLSLPAIDPSGNRLFTNNPVQFVRPHDPNNGYASTAPAFQTPPTPQKCGQGDGKKCQGCLSGKGCLFAKKREEEMRGRCGQLLITPNRLVAPVGGEVIILAGICGKDEHLVTNEAIEYMLDPEGVGQIVEVGDDAKGQRKSFWGAPKEPKVEKLGVDFARGRTSREAGVITKGTADRSDDLPIRKGQTWISLTSPTEGTSKVTILAPDSDVWDKRRQTATVYWIDASWDFPQPQVLAGEQQATLATKVMKSDSFVPARDWTVKYRSLNPEYAEFVFVNPTTGAERLSDTATAQVDAQGIASVVLRRKNLNANGTTNPKSGTALIEIEIIRPILGDMPELPLARSNTSVTWSAPDLVLDAVGPDVTSPGQSVQYLLKVTNEGDQAAENIITKATFPSGMRIDGTSYAPQRSTPNSLIWEFGPLQARSVFEVVINVTPVSPLDAQVLFELSATGQESQQKPVRTNVQQASLTMQLTPKLNVGQVAIGEQAGFDCVLINTGSQSINNIQVEIDSDPGLIHESGGIASTKVLQDVMFLRPGERTVLVVYFRVQREGELGIVGKVTANGQPLANQRSSVRGVSPVPQQPSISLQLLEKSQQRVLTPGVPITIRCIVSNGGPVALRTPVLMLQHDPNFQLQSMDPQGRYMQGEQLVQWNLNDLQPRQTGLEFLATLIPLGPVRQAILKAEVSSDGLRDGKQLTFEIGNPPPVGTGGPGGSMMPGGSSTPSGPNPGISLPSALPGAGGLPSTSPPGLSPAGPASSGPGLIGIPGTSARPAIGSGLATNQRLSISIQPPVQSVKRGDTVSYEVRVENLAAQPDQKVAMQFTIPAGCKLITAKAVGLDYLVSRDGTTVAFTPIQFLRARDSFAYTIQLRHEESSIQTMTAAVKSIGQPDPLSTTHTARVQ
jgi:uncharacterized repeat protein (TIGR01451 family)